MVKKNFLYQIKFWAGLLFAQFILFYLLSKFPKAILLAENIFSKKQDIHQSIFSKISFSIGDLCYILIILFLLISLYKIIRKEERRKHFIRVLMFLNLIYFIYQISWGLLYFQKPIIDKLPQKEASLREIKQLTLQYISLANKVRKQLPEDQNGVYKISNLNNIKKNISLGQSLIPKDFFNKEISSHRNFKTSLFGYLMNYTGILGYYNPFTSEAQYNQHLPNTYIPFTLAHESSHQLGFAREQEANFIGYLICENSKNIELQYSAYLYTSKSLLKYLLKKDPEFAGQALLFFSEKVKKDMANDKEFALQHSGLLEDFFHYSNDLFLKSNQQEGAITYSYFIDLLIRYKRKTSYL